MGRRPRVGIVSLVHESNTWLSAPTGIERFREFELQIGEEIRAVQAGSFTEIAGFLAGLERHGIDAVPIFHAGALPSGPITRDACDALMDLLFAELAKAGELDGVLAAPHGAGVGVGDDYRDFDGLWLTRLRQA
ncbi:MAG: M81 family metallopeptidase, partial [Planctomycetes bacterium]|nr:M81 family metallopeptidase [Planctomycetota bacterium]